jgi:hypothetical protein
VAETIYGNQNLSRRDVPALPDHSGFDQAGRLRIYGELLGGSSRNRKHLPALVMAHYGSIRLRTPKRASGKNGGCS